MKKYRSCIKKYRQLISGIVLGCLLGAGGTVFADTASTITVFVKKNITFRFNGEKKEIPKEDTIFSYNGKTYVPVQFIAESLNSKLEWDKSTKTLSVNRIKTEEEKPVENLSKYRKFPIQQMIGDDVFVNVSGVDVDEDDRETRVYVQVQNKGDKPIYLDQLTAKIVSEGKIYHQKDVNVLFPHDRIWFNDIRKDKNDDKNYGEGKGVLKLPPLDEDHKNITLSFDVIQNDGSGIKHTVSFDIALDDFNFKK